MYRVWRRLRASSGVPREKGLEVMVRLRPARLRLTTMITRPRLLAAIAALRLMGPQLAAPLGHPTNMVVTHHHTGLHLRSRRSQVLHQASQVVQAMERVALHRHSQVLPQASQVVLATERVAIHRHSQILPQASQAVLAIEQVARHHPSQARPHPSLAVTTGLRQVRLVDTDLHRDRLLLMEALLASLAVLVDLAVLLLLVRLRSGSQVRIPMAHHLARPSSPEVGRRSRMVVVVGGKVWLETEDRKDMKRRRIEFEPKV